MIGSSTKLPTVRTVLVIIAMLPDNSIVSQANCVSATIYIKTLHFIIFPLAFQPVMTPQVIRHLANDWFD